MTQAPNPNPCPRSNPVLQAHAALATQASQSGRSAPAGTQAFVRTLAAQPSGHPRQGAVLRRALWAGLLALLFPVGTALAQPTAAKALPGLEPIASGLEHPWALAFLDGGRFLVTERPGRMRVVQANGTLSPPLGGLPPIQVTGQGGLLDLLLDRDFARNRHLYFCYTQAAPQAEDGNTTALARATLSDDATQLLAVQTLFVQQPYVSSRLHFGCRIVQDPSGHLYLALGDRYGRMQDAQRLDNHIGKVLRLRSDGSVPPDNPLVGRAGAKPEIWSWGHRNPQGAAWGPDQRLWTHEHGPQGGDEINRIEPGQNHGWPVLSFGENYGGGAIGQGKSQQAGMADPLHHWTPSIAPSGMAFLDSDRYGSALRGSLLVGSLKFRRLERLTLEQGRLRSQGTWVGLPQRVRDVRVGPDGLVYLLTDARDGQLIRLTPPAQ